MIDGSFGRFHVRVWLDVAVDWDEIAAIVGESYRRIDAARADPIYGIRTGLKSLL